MMCDENGEPLGDKETAAVTAENARAVAVQMTRRRWSESRASDFDGPLNYGPAIWSRLGTGLVSFLHPIESVVLTILDLDPAL